MDETPANLDNVAQPPPAGDEEEASASAEAANQPPPRARVPHGLSGDQKRTREIDEAPANLDNVAQPPPAGNEEEASASAEAANHSPPRARVPHGPHLPPAKPGEFRYRRNLPHLQADGKTIFLTFCTQNRWILPESIRTQILHHCLHDHGTRMHVHGVVVMPDHVHMVLTPLSDAAGCPYTLAEITNGIKGASSHAINRTLGRSGPLWQDESFDHVLRRDEAIAAKVAYICENPIRKRLCRSEDEYPWLWHDPM